MQPGIALDYTIRRTNRRKELGITQKELAERIGCLLILPSEVKMHKCTADSYHPIEGERAGLYITD